MLGKTAAGLFWMFRMLERSENTARLVDAGFRIALTRSAAAEAEWASVISTAGVRKGYLERYDEFNAANVIDYLLRDKDNPSSVVSAINSARTSARLVRTALTREVWEATNEGWMTIREVLKRPVSENGLPDILATIRRQNALVRGALTGTMMQNDVYNFAHLGIFIERADNTARILDVKYYVLLPSVSYVGSSLDNVQWETILRSVSAQRAYRWLSDGTANPRQIANLIILDRRMPRSLAFCAGQIAEHLGFLAEAYGSEMPSHGQARAHVKRLADHSIETIFDAGLHGVLTDFIARNHALGLQIEQDYRFYG